MLVVASLAAAACDEPLSNVAGPSPNLEPTLSSIRTEIFESPDLAGRVACVNCHTNQGRTPAGNLNLTGDVYAALVNARSTGKSGAILVVPGDPDASYLVHKLEGGPDIAGLRMPRNTPPYLTDGQMLVIRRWIQNGAPNN
jgi:cytochrome c